MARYLSPAKIGMLVLIELYTEEAIPSDAILPVLSFISAHVLFHEPARSSEDLESRWARAERSVSLIVSIKDFEKLLGSYPFLMGMPGRKLWDQFLAKLWNINCLDALNQFFDKLSRIFARSKEELQRLTGLSDPEPQKGMKLVRTSPLGAFVRRARIEHVRLRFHDVAELWKDFVRYRQPTAAYMKKKNRDFDQLSFDQVLMHGDEDGWEPDQVGMLATIAYGDMLTGDHNRTLPVSTSDVETLLEFQIQQLQRFGMRIPPELCNQFQDLLSNSFLVPSLNHYLNFLEAWKSGDSSAAFDTLHRYFDYTVTMQSRQLYQYALMNLAMLQAEFGCHQEAIAAMRETVSTARENRDMNCLNLSLQWLFHFGQTHPKLVQDLESDSLLGTAKESLAYLRVKAKESGMWSIWSSVLLSEARMCLANGESIATAFEAMVRSSHLMAQRNLCDMMGTLHAYKVAVWDRLGIWQLSMTSCEVFLRCNESTAVFDDVLDVTAQFSLLLSRRGEYDAALEKLEALDENALRSWKLNRYWHKWRGLLKLQRDLCHDNLDGAEEILDQLLQADQDALESGISPIVSLSYIEYLCARGDLQAAFKKVSSMLADAQGAEQDVSHRVQLLLRKVWLLEKAGRPQRGFSTAIRAANLAWKARCMPLLWRAIGAISSILVSMGEFEPATQLLVAVIPRSLEHEFAQYSADLYSCLADANMGLAGLETNNAGKRLEFMTRAHHAVQKAFDLYSGIEDIKHQLEMMAKKATIMKLTGDTVLAADYAAAYSELQQLAITMRKG